jgi:hypothetical protein
MKIDDLTTVKNDLYGNGRYVAHFLRFITDHEIETLSIEQQYRLAHSRSLKCGGKIYRGKEYGGGFVFTTSSPQRLVEFINDMMKKIRMKEKSK